MAKKRRRGAPLVRKTLKAIRQALSNVIKAKDSATGKRWRELHRLESGLTRQLGRTTADTHRTRKARGGRK